MRILLLSLSLFVVQNTLTNDALIESMQAIAPGIALSMIGGAVTELLYPFSTLVAFDPVHPLVIIVTSTLGMAMTAHNLKKSGYEFIARLISGPAFFAGFYSYCTAAKGIIFVRKKLLAWYENKNTVNKIS